MPEAKALTALSLIHSYTGGEQRAFRQGVTADPS
jgi:hypothetical protein